MLRVRIDDRACLHLLRKWLKAGIRDTDGQVVYPETGTPQGGTVSPVLAHVYRHYALDIWLEKVVKPRGRGEALVCRYADDWVCAFRDQEDAERFFSGAAHKAGAIQSPGGTRENPSVPVQPFAPEHEAAFHLAGMRVVLDTRSARRAPRQAAHCTPEAPNRLPTAHGMDQATPAPAGAGVLPASACATTRPLQLLGRARERSLAQPLFPTGHGRYVQVAQPARRQAA